MTMGPRTYAPVLAAFLVLWPIIAYMGAQGYSGAIAIAALLALGFVRVRSIPIFVISGLAFAAWVLASGFWGPEAAGFVTGDLLAGSFSMDMPGVRFALTALAALAVLVAIAGCQKQASRLSLGVIVAAGLAQFGGVVVTALFMPEILALLAPFSDPVSEMPQNLIRNANTLLLLLPFLLAWVWHRDTSEYWPIWSMALAIISLAAFLQTGTQSAVIGMGCLLLAMLIVNRFPQNGFKILTSSLAVYIVAAPHLIGWGLAQIRASGLPLPKSFFSRSYSWDLVGAKIQESPVIGHGPEASHIWRDTFADHPDWLADAVARYGDQYAWEVYPIVPVHPHNMPLQIWSETGMVGAILAAVFVFFLGWRLKPPSEWPPVARYAAAGLIGVCLSLGSFAYSMWNEAFWASVVFAASVIFLQARHRGEAGA